MANGIRFNHFDEDVHTTKNAELKRLCMLDWIVRHKFTTRPILFKLLRFEDTKSGRRAFQDWLQKQQKLGYIKLYGNGVVVGRQIIRATAQGLGYLQTCRSDLLEYYNESYQSLTFTQLNHDVLIQRMILNLAYQGDADFVDYVSEVEFRHSERLAGRAPKNRKYPDGIYLTKSGERVAVEVEINVKAKYKNVFLQHQNMLDEKAYSRIRYFVPAINVKNRVEEVIKHMRLKKNVSVQVVPKLYAEVYGITSSNIEIV
jgi:hypothetical protein